MQISVGIGLSKNEIWHMIENKDLRMLNFLSARYQEELTVDVFKELFDKTQGKTIVQKHSFEKPDIYDEIFKSIEARDEGFLSYCLSLFDSSEISKLTYRSTVNYFYLNFDDADVGDEVLDIFGRCCGLDEIEWTQEKSARKIRFELVRKNDGTSFQFMGLDVYRRI